MVLQLLISGVSMGVIYALMGMGLILIVKAVGVMNFAHGDIFMFGAYISYMLSVQVGMPPLAVLLVGILIMMIFGALYMFSVYWPLRKASWPVTVTISTLGASMVIKELVRFIWGPFNLRVEPIIPGGIQIGSAHIEYQYLFILLVGGIIIVSVFLLFEKLRVGRVMSAAAQDRYAADLIGIPTILTICATFMISLSISGVAGYLAAPVFLVTQSLGSFAFKAFAGIVVGGFGNVKGSVIGSLIIGVIESFSILITSTYKDAVVFVVLIIVLLIRPQGIFGEKISEKA